MPVGVTGGEVVAIVVCLAPSQAVGFALLVHEHNVAIVDCVQLQMRAPSAAVASTQADRNA